MLTASDAAGVLECSSDNVRRLTRAGVLRPAFATAVPPRPVNLYRRGDVEALRAKRARPQRTPIPTERRSRKAVRPVSWEFIGQAVPAQPGWELVTLRDVSGRPEHYTMNREAIHAWGVYARRGTASGEFDLPPMTVRPMTADQNGRACALWYGPDHLENEVVVGVLQMGQHPPVADIDAAAETLRTRHKLAVQGVFGRGRRREDAGQLHPAAAAYLLTGTVPDDAPDEWRELDFQHERAAALWRAHRQAVVDEAGRRGFVAFGLTAFEGKVVPGLPAWGRHSPEFRHVLEGGPVVPCPRCGSRGAGLACLAPAGR